MYTLCMYVQIKNVYMNVTIISNEVETYDDDEKILFAVLDTGHLHWSSLSAHVNFLLSSLIPFNLCPSNV